MHSLQIHNLTVRAKGKLLLENTSVTIAAGRRYGLVGPNGRGKSTLLRLIARRQVPVPENIDVLLVEQEIVGDDKCVRYNGQAGTVRQLGMSACLLCGSHAKACQGKGRARVGHSCSSMCMHHAGHTIVCILTTYGCRTLRKRGPPPLLQCPASTPIPPCIFVNLHSISLRSSACVCSMLTHHLPPCACLLTGLPCKPWWRLTWSSCL